MSSPDFPIAILGAGFGGIGMAIKLKKAGIGGDQAEAHVAVIASAMSESDLATKADIVALKADIDKLRASTKADISALEAKLRTEIAQAVNKVMVTQIAVAGLLFAALKFF